MSDSERDEINASFAVIMRAIGEHAALIHTCRTYLQTLGVKREDFEAELAAVKARWEEASRTTLQRIGQRRDLEALQKFLETAGDTTH